MFKTLRKNLNSVRDDLYKYLVVFIIIVSFIVWSFSFMFALTWIDKPFSGFLFYNNLVISNITIDDSILDNNQKIRTNSDKVIAINGEKVSSPDDVYNIVNKYDVGTPLDYSILRGEEIFEYTAPTINFNIGHFISIFFVIYLIGLLYLVIGVSVYFLRPLLDSSKIFFMFCACIGLWFINYFDSQSTYIFSKISNLGFIFAPTFVIYLATVFPQNRLLNINRYLILSPFFALSLALFLLNIDFFNDLNRWLAINKLHWGYTILGSLVLSVSSLNTYLTTNIRLEKQRSQVVLTGSIIGLLLPSLLLVLTSFLGLNIPIGIIALFLIVFPASIAYSILKHKLFDIEVIIKKALVYGFLTGLLGGIIAITIITFNLFLASYGGWRNPAFFIILSAFLAVALSPLQNKIQTFIDLVFFRKKFDYRKTVEEISFTMTSLLNPYELNQKILDTIEKTIFSKNNYLFIYDETEKTYKQYSESNNLSTEQNSINEDNGLIILLKKFKNEVFFEDISIEDKFREHKPDLEMIFKRYEAFIVMPMFVKEKLIGVLSLGEKKSDLSYTSEDLELLRTLANQSAIAIENALAFKLVEDYAKKLEETNIELRETQAQLIQSEKMSAIGQLAAGIAHEIRNPLNIIEGARYYLSHLLSKDQKTDSVNEYLDYIKQEVERTNRFIGSLLKFSKSEAARFELVDINSTLENTLILLKKQISDGDVNAIRIFDDNLPSIFGDTNQLWQVFVNIIMNAIQAMPEGGDLTIKTNRNGQDSIWISFKDTGIGMDKEDLSKMFDPFFTKKDAGTGLGLSISYSIIESHHGNIKVESEKGVGTDFTIELPLDQK